MSTLFGEDYASAYDALYADKDYEGECDVFEKMFAFAAAPVRRVLDLGCGTGGHALPLARGGYSVVGIDRSPGMLARARAKAIGQGDAQAVFCEADIRTLNLGTGFDAVLMPFAVLGYQLSNADVHSALCAARRHLTAGGVLMFDVWYGPAVLHLRPSERVKAVSIGPRTLRRSATATLETSTHSCEIQYRLSEAGPGLPAREATETHVLRYFFPLELDQFLERAHFSLGRLSSFPDVEQAASDERWNVLVVARAI